MGPRTRARLPWAHLVADLLHILAAAVWIGALAGLLVLLSRAYNRNGNRGERTTLAKRALTGFSNVGSMAVATIILTGLINSWVLGGLANVPSLGNSLYGRLLLLKLILFCSNAWPRGLEPVSTYPGHRKVY